MSTSSQIQHNAGGDARYVGSGGGSGDETDLSLSSATTYTTARSGKSDGGVISTQRRQVSPKPRSRINRGGGGDDAVDDQTRRPIIERRPRQTDNVLTAADDSVSRQRWKSVLVTIPPSQSLWRRVNWWRVAVIICLVILAYALICECVRETTRDILYHDWWYLREAVLNEQFSRRPFMYDVRYFVIADGGNSEKQK